MNRPALHNFRRTWWALGWLVLGVGCGLLLAHGHVAGTVGKSDGKQTGVNAPSIKQSSEDSPSLRRQRVAGDPTVSVTPGQLERIAAGGGRLPEFSAVVGLQHLFGYAGMIPTAEEQDEKLKQMLEGTCDLLSLNSEEADQLRAILTETTRELIEIERASLPIREKQPGTLELDFDSLADLEAPVFERMRSQLRAKLGQSALRDLEVLGGLNGLTGASGESKNCEMRLAHEGAGWEAWCIVPGPGGREGQRVGMPGTEDYRQAVEDLVRLGGEGRFTHLSSRIPENLTTP